MYFSQDCEGEILSALSSADIFLLLSQTSVVVWKRLSPTVSGIWTLGPQLAVQFWEQYSLLEEIYHKGWALSVIQPWSTSTSLFLLYICGWSHFSTSCSCCHACHMHSCLLPWWSYLSGTLSQNRLLQVSSISIGVWSQQQKRNINQMTQRVQEDVWKYKFKYDVILCKSVNIWRRLYSRVRWESFSRTSHCTYYTWYPDTVCLTVTLSGLKSFNYGSIVSSWNGASQTLVTKGTL